MAAAGAMKLRPFDEQWLLALIRAREPVFMITTQDLRACRRLVKKQLVIEVMTRTFKPSKHGRLFVAARANNPQSPQPRKGALTMASDVRRDEPISEVVKRYGHLRKLETEHRDISWGCDYPKRLTDQARLADEYCCVVPVLLAACKALLGAIHTPAYEGSELYAAIHEARDAIALTEGK